MPPRKAAAATSEAPRRSSRVAAMPQPPPKKAPVKRKAAAPKKKKGEEGEGEATEEKKDGEEEAEEKMQEDAEAKKGTKRTQDEANAEAGEAETAEGEPKPKKAKPNSKPNSKASAKPVSKSSRAGSKGPSKAKADHDAAAPGVDTIAEEGEGDDAAKKKALGVGDVLPTMTLKNEKGEDLHIAELAKEKGVVMFLVPKADTPGCTTQACAFRDSYEEFTKLDYVVYCLSADTSIAGSKWQTKQNLPYSLISDGKRELISALGAGSSKTTRSHFVIEKGTGKILDVKLNVKAADSSKIALEFIQAHAK